METKILDCTLRDGGYYNNWDFDSVLVQNYLSAIAKSGVHYVELGLRQLKSDRYLGPHAFTTFQYLERLNLPKGPVYGVMIDAKTILSCDEKIELSLNKLFKDCADEKIDLVRVAAHFHEVPECFEIVRILKNKGYMVGLNIMQASLKASYDLEILTKQVEEWNTVDVLYFADSLGSMMGPDMERVYNAIRSSWSGDIGFHAHNNMGQGVDNANIAVSLGCKWIDGTVTGMGRGAGNAETEYLFEQEAFNYLKTDKKEIDSLVVKYFDPLKIKYGWGPSIPYLRAAQYGIHPTYIQDLCSSKVADKGQLMKIIFDLGKIEKPHIYSKKILSDVISKTDGSKAVLGSFVKPIFEGKEVVLVAQTDSSASYCEAIRDYVKAKNAVLISINLPAENQLIYDYCVITHNEKYRKDEAKYSSAHYKFIAPAKLFQKESINISYDYGLFVDDGNFKVKGNYAVLPNRLTLSYAIAFCLEAKADLISLAGFDGYDTKSSKQKEMQSFLALLMAEKINIQSLTPTSYLVPEVSIYCV